MEHLVLAFPDRRALAGAAAEHVASYASEAIARHGRFNLAVSGGSTPREMFEELRLADLDWGSVVIHQVDERFAPDGDSARNLTGLQHALEGVDPRVVPMPTGMQHCSEAERQAAAETYSDSLPDSFDLVHLGLGADGHTASLVPGDPLLEENTGLVGCTCVYQGHHRMTLTYPALRRARSLMWLVAGAEKTSALASLLHGDTTIPAGRVVAGESVVMADAAALGREHT